MVRVHELVAEEKWSKRYHHIKEFERLLADEGTRIVKIFLNISKEEQAERLRARLEEPAKAWKFHKSDLANLELWDDFRTAYKKAIERTSTDFAPWYVVAANRKWYRNLVVSSILIDTLEDMNPKYPPPERGLDEVSIT